MIDFRGYEYTREPSAISGALMTRYNNKRPQIWRIPLADQVQPSVTVTAPRGGYIVPAAHADWIGEKLALHGIEVRNADERALRKPQCRHSARPRRPCRRQPSKAAHR